MLIDQCLAYSSPEKLLPAADRNKYRSSQVDNVWRTRNLGTFSPRCLHIISPRITQRAMGKRRHKDYRHHLGQKTQIRLYRYARTDTHMEKP